jgi:ATPase subunit of ABC transporter with duplicated ATPase domains
MLTVSQLSKSFAGQSLFDDVSLQVNRGADYRNRIPVGFALVG